MEIAVAAKCFQFTSFMVSSRAQKGIIDGCWAYPSAEIKCIMTAYFKSNYAPSVLPVICRFSYFKRIRGVIMYHLLYVTYTTLNLLELDEKCWLNFCKYLWLLVGFQITRQTLLIRLFGEIRKHPAPRNNLPGTYTANLYSFFGILILSLGIQVLLPSNNYLSYRFGKTIATIL